MDYLARALTLAKAGEGKTGTNPSVGCVLVKGGVIIAEGTTAVGGRPHAETQALEFAGAKARGSHAYVTLEPCAHTGQTPPCADALIRAGIGGSEIVTIVYAGRAQPAYKRQESMCALTLAPTSLHSINPMTDLALITDRHPLCEMV